MQNSLFHDQQIIRCLWMNNPYATLMPLGKIETRTRPTNVRGKVLICSCLKSFTEDKIMSISGEWQMGRIYEALRLNKVVEKNGVAVCIADLVDCREMTEADSDACYVQYNPEKKLYCWIFDKVRRVEPFEIKGNQGWKVLRPWEAEEKAIIDKIRIKKAIHY